MVLHRNWPTLDTTRSLRPWLFGVAFRVVRTHRRRRAREAPHAGAGPGGRRPHPGGVAARTGIAGPAVGRAATCPRVASVRRHQARPGRSRGHRHRARAVHHEVRRLRAGSTRDARSWPPPCAGCGRKGRGDEAPRFRPRAGAGGLARAPRRSSGSVPPELRARVLARARAIARRASAIPPAPPLPLRRRCRRAPRARRRLLRIALAASIAIAGAAVGAVAALHGRTRSRARGRVAGAPAPGAEPFPVTSVGSPRREPPATRRGARSRRQAAAPGARRCRRAIRSPPSSSCFSALMPRTRDATSRSR